MAHKYLCRNMETGFSGYGGTPEQAFQDMLHLSREDSRCVNPDYIQFWQSIDLQVVVETKIVVKNSTGE